MLLTVPLWTASAQWSLPDWRTGGKKRNLGPRHFMRTEKFLPPASLALSPAELYCKINCWYGTPKCVPIYTLSNWIYTTYFIQSGPGIVVGIATGYGLDGPGIESRWGRDFPHLYRPALGPTQPPAQWVPGLSRGQRAARAWRWPLTPF